MITTVTTSTITTVTIMATMGLSITIGVATVITLMALLTTKELVGASLSPSSRLVAKFLIIGILPLIMAFAVIVIVRIATLLA